MTSLQTGGFLLIMVVFVPDSYAAATVVLQEDHKLILESLERHRDNSAVLSAL